MPLSDTFMVHFVSLKDPRKDTHNKRHKLMDILVLTILAVICGADSWVEVEEFGEEKIEWLKTFLELPNGIPSHDTIGDVFARLNAKELEQSFLSWITSLVTISEGDLIALDGKTLRRSHNASKEQRAIHMVSAWANRNRLVLGQVKVADKSNEITAIPELLKMLDITGCVITIDAMGCQKKIAEQIIGQGGDYVLAVKENQGTLYTAVVESFARAEEQAFSGMVYSQDTQLEKDHGRIETRRFVALPMMYLHAFKLKWKGFKSILMVESKREIKNEVSVEKRYYICSLPAEAKELGRMSREHWGIENSLHWNLDVSFREDECRVRIGEASENFSVIRRIALNLLRMEKTSKVGIKIKRSKAGWNSKYLMTVLAAGGITEV